MSFIDCVTHLLCVGCRSHLKVCSYVKWTFWTSIILFISQTLHLCTVNERCNPNLSIEWNCDFNLLLETVLINIFCSAFYEKCIVHPCLLEYWLSEFETRQFSTERPRWATRHCSRTDNDTAHDSHIYQCLPINVAVWYHQHYSKRRLSAAATGCIAGRSPTSATVII